MENEEREVREKKREKMPRQKGRKRKNYVKLEGQ